jgi:hypothetical protein
MKKHDAHHFDVDPRGNAIKIDESYWYCEECIEGSCPGCDTFHEDEEPLPIN